MFVLGIKVIIVTAHGGILQKPDYQVRERKIFENLLQVQRFSIAESCLTYFSM